MVTDVRPRGKLGLPRHVRPGWMIKDILSGQLPLIRRSEEDPSVLEEAIVSEACIQELSFSYKQYIRRENELRGATHKLRGMVYSSFVKLFKFVQLLGLVSLVDERPMRFSPGDLLSVRDHERHEVVESMRRFFELSEHGVVEGVAWQNLVRAWSEGWHIPSAAPPVEAPPVEVPEAPPVEVPEAPPEAVPVRPRRPPKAKVPPELLPIPVEKGSLVGIRNIKRVIKYLGELEGVELTPELTKNLELVENRLEDWLVETEDAIDRFEEREDEEGAEKARLRYDWLEIARGALEEHEISEAIAALERSLKKE